MIYDDQPQMVKAAWDAHVGEWRRERVMAGLERAFAAIDREALIEKATGPVTAPGATWEGRKRIAERVLVAAGIIPERKSDIYKRITVGK